ncbi:MAG TPA: hypothetical protein VHC92_09685 [Rhodanobacteraceae bacterium]|jgi:hypothetical protein|nr:hypothetical protein [Rhodanobacteraceae bacterium]
MIRWRLRTRARHPLARLVAVVAGAVALAIVVALGLFAAAALVVGGTIVLLAKTLSRPSPSAATPRPSRPAAAGGIIEGEFKIVEDTRAR